MNRLIPKEEINNNRLKGLKAETAIEGAPKLRIAKT
jgi:hypothetical protein